jgi:hypothetical protein
LRGAHRGSNGTVVRKAANGEGFDPVPLVGGFSRGT